MEKRNRYKFLAAIVVLVLLFGVALALFGLRFRWSEPVAEVDDNDYEVQGIDLSAHNGNVDFAQVKKAGIDFVIMKASEGQDFRDAKFAANYADAKAQGFYVGAYHFFRFDVEGKLQAENFMDAVGDCELSLPLVIDVEEHGNPYVFVKSRVVRQLQNMVDELESNEYHVMFYTNKIGYDKFIKGNFDDYPLWICSFTHPAGVEWTIWQYSHWGSVDGIEGDVDLNLFYGNGLQWKRWLQ